MNCSQRICFASNPPPASCCSPRSKSKMSAAGSAGKAGCPSSCMAYGLDCSRQAPLWPPALSAGRPFELALRGLDFASARGFYPLKDWHTNHACAKDVQVYTAG